MNNIKKILTILILIATITAGITHFISNRYTTGEVLTREYSEELDVTITTIVTKDGNMYEVYDYTAPHFSPMLIHFDTNNTSNVTDDEIVSIICFTDVR